MIPYALKLVWFGFSLAGVFVCWYAFIILPGRNFGGLWGRLWYCILLTWLEVAFCLGLMYHMDPHRMPHSFCLFQTLSFSMAAFGLSGWCCSFSIATALAVLRPRAFNDASAALSWHPRYIPTLILFPICASALYATLVIKLNAVKPVSSDDLHCDVTDPIWLRLLGYGGISPLMTIPFLCLSLFIAKRLHGLRYESENISTDQGLSTTQQSFEMLDTSAHNNVSLPPEKFKPKRMISRKSTDGSSKRVSQRRSRESVGSDTIPVFDSSHFSGDFKASVQPLEIHVERDVTLITEESSTKFLIDNPDTPPEFSSLSISPQRRALESLTKYESTPPFFSLYSPNSSEPTSATPMSTTKLLFSPSLPRTSQIIDFNSILPEENEADSKVPPWEVADSEYDEKGRLKTNPNEAQLRALKSTSKFIKGATRGTSRNIHSKKITGAYRRMILLQVGYFLVQLLSSLSTIIDISRNRLTPFGTQHIALILAGWGPYIIYLGVKVINRWIDI